MRAVTYDGEPYLLVKESTDSSLVRDPETGAEEYVPNDALEPADDPPLTALAAAVPGDVRTVLRVAHDDRALGLLVDLQERGPLPVERMLAAYDLCESDLLGLLTECRAAGVVAETTVAGEHAYDLTDAGERGVDRLLELAE